MGEGTALRAGLFEGEGPREARHHPASPISHALSPNLSPDLLRFTTAGSVDDGKSTLIGRLLYDSKAVYEDQVASVRKATRNLTTGGLDLSLLTDGLRAEREQGITIDVAYRYFSTARRKFIIADTPGHEQYTRNMATGASTADLAIILIDARLGVLAQSRRHGYIASLLGIPHIVVAVNKMDLVGFRQEVFENIRREFAAFAGRLAAQDMQFIPLSALDGDNVVERSLRTPWYGGPSLLEHLETVPLVGGYNRGDFRFPVQYVIRPNQNFRGFAGRVASGVVRRGDAVTVLPSGRRSCVKEIVTWNGNLQEAFAPMSIALCLEDELDISRGDMLVGENHPPHAARRFQAQVVWMSEKPLAPHHGYLLKQTTQMVQARVREVRHRVNIQTLEPETAAGLELNEIGLVELETHRPLFFDAYAMNRATGSFILIDALTNETAGAGMIAAASAEAEGHGRVTAAERHARYGHSAAVIVVEDERQAHGLERYLFDRGCQVAVVGAETSRDLPQALTDAGFLVIAVVGAAGFPEVGGAPVLRGLEQTTPAAIWSRLADAGAVSPQVNLGGDGI
jgi:sulfate adenylyltransferase large subunit